ncbi:endonuclease/exonuclease/phosphatase family protein [Streptomyces sp. NPDC059009]|uniref:endonuclease/exonuclease/phosphatase family protein n=1 Tax=Streptomyces sp. NPDC059009 TaxID=3346694 RepID=UPI0036905F6D
MTATAPVREPDEGPGDLLPYRRPSLWRRPSAWLAGLLLLGASVVLGCRIADVDGVTPVPQLLAFLPWLLAPAGLGLLLAGLARWRIGLLWAVVVLGGLAWYMEPYGKADDAPGKPFAELRVMTSNVEFGRGTDGLIKAVKKERPDLLFVEECDFDCDRKLKKAFEPGVYPYRSAVEASGAEGSVILSKVPLTKAEGIPATLGMPGAVADVKGEKVRLQLAHPMPPTPGDLGVWRKELGALREYVESGGGRSTIVAGDFNATQDHAAFRGVLDAGVRDGSRLAGSSRSPSWPADLPSPLGAQIDHVLATKDFAARDARFLEIGNTDHRALVLDLTLHREDG